MKRDFRPAPPTPGGGGGVGMGLHFLDPTHPALSYYAPH